MLTSNDEFLAEVVDADDGGNTEQSDESQEQLEPYEACQL